MTGLDRRLTALEARLQPPPAPAVILIVGMAKAGHRWLPTRFTLADGSALDRGDGETPEAFATRVRKAALAALPKGHHVAIAVAVDGDEVPAHAGFTAKS